MFKDLKVIELAGVLAGPAVGMFFSELGAEVIKVENRDNGGDMTRSWKLASESKEATVSAYFSSVNFNKSYVSKDLRNLDDRELVYRLIADADIVITNFKEGSAEKLKVDYKTLSTLNSKLIYAAIEGFSSNSEKVAFDMVLQAETGFMAMNGYPGQDPVKMPVALIDILAAHQLKEGILVALIKRIKTGTGSLVKVSLEEAAFASLANQASNFLMEKHVPQRMGSLHPNIAPYGEVFSTQKGNQVVLAIGTNKQFKSLCSLLNCDDLFLDDRFINNTQRVSNRTALFDLLSPHFNQMTTEQIMTLCLENKVPIGEIKDMEQVMKNPVAIKMVLSEKIEGIETKRLKTVAFHISN